MESKQVQLYLDREKTIEASPETSANCVILSDSNDLQKVLDNDLTTPTVVHEETSFKVGQGDIDVSGSIVDGEVGQMVIKGQTYQNILPEPSLRNSMTNGKTMQKLNEGYDSVNTVDGVCKSAILSGNTLVNLATHSKRQTINVQNLSELNGRLTWNTTGSWGKVGFTIQGKPNTNYCIKYDDRHETLGIYVRFLDGLSGTTQSTTRLSPTCVKFTTDTTGIFTLTLEQGSATTGSWIQSPMIIEYVEGMENWDIPYFTGMKSVRMPVLKSVGKNLYNKNTSFSGWVNSNGDIIKNGAVGVGDNILSDYIKISPTKRYKMSMAHYQWYYDTNKKYIDQPETVGADITPPNNASYVVVGKSISRLNEQLFSTLDSIQLEEGSTSTSYEPYKLNILHTPEEVVLRSVENAQDTINLNTGEYVQRIGEVILNGSESWHVLDNNTENTIGFTLRKVLPLRKTGDKYVKVNCDKLPSYKENLWNNDKIGCVAENNINQDLNDTQLQVRVLKSTLSTQDTNGFKSWLQTNPLTIQYILETPVVKTVDLSSSGNWEKRALDGTETNWRIHNAGIPTHTCFACELPNLLLQGMVICNEFKADNIWNPYEEKIMTHSTVRQLYLNLDNSRGITTVSKLKEYLSQNPITIWYQTQNHLDSTQVKQPIFFKDGHIQLSSGADNSLIPTLDYQAKTSNSYVMDLMKPNTIYTMKLKSGNGAFVAQGGQSIGFMVNRTFNSGNLPNDKLFYTTGWVDDLMILEGDLTSKTIPYFKGIKSTFEDESKIEVLSTGKNLFNAYKHKFDTSSSPGLRVEVLSSNSIRTYCTDTVAWRAAFVVYQLEPHTWYNIRCEVTGNGTKQLDINIPEYGTSWNPNTVNCTQSNNMLGKFLTDESGKVKLTFQGSGSESISYDNTYTNIQIEKIQEKSTVHSFYEPYKSNNTKIPLLSPLRSLQNGVCDELIIDRMKKKATLIQRVGHVMLDGSEEWGVYPTMEQDKTLLFQSKADCKQGKSSHCVSDRFPYSGSLWNSGFDGEGVMMGGGGSTYKRVDLRIYKGKVSSNNTTILREYLSKNPITVCYELKTPVVTEIDLENFPLVYKDGHIFLNSEIAPVVEIDYNVNQTQQIQANNETLQRHELDILDLDNLIVSFVNAEYNLRLLKFDMELSMMALAE